MEMTPGRHVLVFCREEGRREVLSAAVRAAGYQDSFCLLSLADLPADVMRLSPAMVLLDIQSPDREDVFAQALAIIKELSLPVMLLSDDADGAWIDQGVSAGAAAFIVGSLLAERIAAAIPVAASRHRHISLLSAELAAVRKEMADRKVVDQAKRLLMNHKGLNEEQAYTLLRKTAMSRSVRMAQIARSMLDAAVLLEDI